MAHGEISPAAFTALRVHKNYSQVGSSRWRNLKKRLSPAPLIAFTVGLAEQVKGRLGEIGRAGEVTGNPVVLGGNGGGYDDVGQMLTARFNGDEAFLGIEVVV